MSPFEISPLSTCLGEIKQADSSRFQLPLLLNTKSSIYTFLLILHSIGEISWPYLSSILDEDRFTFSKVLEDSVVMEVCHTVTKAQISFRPANGHI